jgi:hypothetical protein
MCEVDKAHLLESRNAIQGRQDRRDVVWQCLCPWFHLSPSILSLTQRTWSQARDIVGPFSEKTGGRSVGEQD